MEDHLILSEIRRALTVESDAISALGHELDPDQIMQVTHVLADCKGRIIVSGCGTSAMAARKIAHSLCCIERPAFYLSPSDSVHGALGVVQKEDVVILISKGGNTKELTVLIPTIKAKGAYLIGVSENPESIIARNADIYLHIKVFVEPCPFNMLATASTLAVIATFDAICISLMGITGYTREQFALIHPAGAVGDRLLGRVSES